MSNSRGGHPGTREVTEMPKVPTGPATGARRPGTRVAIPVRPRRVGVTVRPAVPAEVRLELVIADDDPSLTWEIWVPVEVAEDLERQLYDALNEIRGGG